MQDLIRPIANDQTSLIRIFFHNISSIISLYYSIIIFEANAINLSTVQHSKPKRSIRACFIQENAFENARWQPFCLSLNVLRTFQDTGNRLRFVVFLFVYGLTDLPISLAQWTLENLNEILDI